ncbi:SusD/RagB family nutrient-binding outer membrane lipoprotein [Olivibacter ginsenosidimutans]|uniref:SusD/RagB family nutrient-binding outer membrane lipoprotein n=1 Tax=Olivibacter ginsenosidimutans TaxID=1176537 RepID=A0ABP9B277_9SPHI
MKISYIQYGIIIILVSALTACKKYLDVNIDPENPTKVPAASRIIGAITTSNGAAQWRGSREIAGVTQYGLTGKTTGSNRNAETWRFTSSYFLWQNTYVNTLPNCVDLTVLGNEEGNLHFVGVGKTLMALNFGLLADQYGSIVVDDFYDGINPIQLTPKFNTQQEVYERIQTLLDEALIAFDGENQININANDGDIIYGGDIEKWKKFAWALKARYLNHLSKKSGLYNPDAIIDACQHAFDGDGMDAEFPYLAAKRVDDINSNPWSSWGGFSSTDDPRYLTWSQFFINMLSSFPVTNKLYQDPRISKIMKPGKDDVYRGLSPGAGLEGGQGRLPDGSAGDPLLKDSTLYSRFSNSGFYTNETSPFPFITYAEVKFIEAEARLRNADVAGALSAYEEGVKANMRKLGVESSAINQYWQAQLSDGLSGHFNDLNKGLSHIMRQKYIALCLHPETWVDMRRMDYSKEIYGPSFTRPTNLNTVIFDQNNENQWIQAMVYENNEQTRNPDAVGDNTEKYRLLTPLWWNVTE